MSLHIILMGGPKSGTLHEVSAQRSWHEGDELRFNVWPDLPRTADEAEEQWPDLPKRQYVYQLEAVPQHAVPGTAIYVGERP